MIKSLTLNMFKTKSFKAITLIFTLVVSSGLMVMTSQKQDNNSISENNKLSGFHITVKQKNDNLVKEANTWNIINNNYEEFLNNNKMLITEQFNNWSEIINSVQNKKPSADKISQDVNAQFMKQIKNPKYRILPNNDYHYFSSSTIIGRSVAKQSLNNIPSFGDIYVKYHDNLPTKVSNGLFATINPSSDFNEYFSIPYTIQPSSELKSKKIEDRIKEIPLANDNEDVTNQSTLLILARNDMEQLMVNDSHANIIDNGALSYIILNHKPSDGLKPTTYNITVQKNKDTIFSNKSISLTNNCSNIQFTNVNDSKDSAQVPHKFLIKQDSTNNKNALIVMNQASESAKINFSESQNWRKWSVDLQTLTKVKGDLGTAITNGDTISVNEGSDYQVYCIALDTTDLAQQAASEQYLIVSKKDTPLPKFNNCYDFFQMVKNKPNALLIGFQQYLTTSSSQNNIINVSDLKINAGEFLSWFIAYENSIIRHNYVNYINSNLPSSPWNINEQSDVKTLVNHWNIIIIAILFFSLLIIVPIVVFIMRKKKYLK